MITLYGIKTCDTCRKALKWIDGEGMAHRFHDFRADGLNPVMVKAWIKALGWEAVLNRRSTTWREIPEKDRAAIDEKSAVALMLKHPTLIKRPVIEVGKAVLIGFTDETRQALRKA